MSWGVTASPPGYCPRTPLHHPLSSSYFRPTATGSHKFRRINLRCNCSSKPGESGPGENESRSVLDAFFLGKALAEALNERIESTLGEFLSSIGRLQAEQQKQVEEFQEDIGVRQKLKVSQLDQVIELGKTKLVQEDVLERAERAKKQAAREAKGLIPKSSETKITTATNGVSSATSSSPSPTNPLVERVKMDPGSTDEDSPLEVSEED